MANMIPFRRGSSTSSRRSSQESSQPPAADSGDSSEIPRKGGLTAAWQARQQRRRKNASSNSNGKKGVFPTEEYDPYDSDPGESYREHCERIKGEARGRSCLTMPRFLQNIKIDSISQDNSKAPNYHSSLLDQDDDMSSHAAPASLPRELAKVRYSLRTAIGDGSQPQAKAHNLMGMRDLRPNQVHINVSHWSDFGGREYMEDRYSIEDLGAVQVEVSPVAVNSSKQQDDGVEVTFGSRKNRRLKMPLTWIGVFDGHGGDKASQFCADWFSSYVRNEDSFPFDLGYAMKNAYTNIDDDFLATGHPDGSTACTATLVGGRRIICANAGDSRAIVVRRDGTVVRLSRDHKPGMPDETRRISDLGGRVIYWGRWRVEGLLAVSRSIGDASLKPYVCADPEVCEYDIGKDDWFLIMSSDGVWDVMDNEEAAHVVIASSCVMEDGVLKIDTQRFKWAARNLCEHARSCGSTDNFSVVVVDLKSCGNPMSKSGRYQP